MTRTSGARDSVPRPARLFPDPAAPWERGARRSLLERRCSRPRSRGAAQRRGQALAQHAGRLRFTRNSGVRPAQHAGSAPLSATLSGSREPPPGGRPLPVPADFDGDGLADFAVWRQSDNTWYIIRSSDGGVTVQTWSSHSVSP